jgi:hypothetical protein
MKLSAGVVAAVLATGTVGGRLHYNLKRQNTTLCKCLPGESCWPVESRWSGLKQAVQGRLYAVTPPGAVCHPNFNNVSTADAAKCSAVKASWTDPNWMYVPELLQSRAVADH